MRELTVVDDNTTPHSMLEHGGLQVEYRPATWDKETAADVLRRGEYSRAALTPGDVWLDVGGHIGCFALLAAQNGCAVYSFEPEAANFEILKRNIAHNEMQSAIAIYPVAITAREDHQIPFYINRYKGKGAHSVVPRNGRQEVLIPNYHVNNVLQTFPAINNIKIDAEGAEVELILGIAPEFWPRIQQLIFEFHFNIHKDRNIYLQLVQLLQLRFPNVSYRTLEELGGTWDTVVCARR